MESGNDPVSFPAGAPSFPVVGIPEIQLFRKLDREGVEERRTAARLGAARLGGRSAGAVTVPVHGAGPVEAFAVLVRSPPAVVLLASSETIFTGCRIPPLPPCRVTEG